MAINLYLCQFDNVDLTLLLVIQPLNVKLTTSLI